MICKKMAFGSLLLGMVLGFSLCIATNSLDYRLFHLKRKINCLKRKIDHTIKNMSKENLAKYKEEILNEYEMLKEKVDNLTIKDIKDKTSEVFKNIINSINEFKNKLMSYSK